MKVIGLVPRMFYKNAMNELSLDNMTYIEPEYIVGDTDKSKKEILDYAKDAILTHNLFSVDFEKSNFDLEYVNELAEGIEGLLENKTFAIDTVSYKSKTNTRDIEVKLGTRLEEMGYSANIQNPDQLIFTVLNNDNLYLGVVEAKDAVYRYLDNAKRFSKRKGNINRAQYKIVEAIERFDIDIGKGIALDIGAAPGGWTQELINHGFEVYAVDPGKLNEELLKNPKVTHIQKKIEDSDLSDSYFDVVTNDMNMDPRESSEIMVSLAPYLKSKGTAIMTAKLITKNVERMLREVKPILIEAYKIKKIKHLQHNRQEVTLLLEKNE